MKHLFTVFLLLTFFTASGQTDTPVSKLNFCGIEYPVPAGCESPNPNNVSCSTYSLNWVYMNVESLKVKPDQILESLAERVKEFSKAPITGYLLNTVAQGYKISYKTNTGTAYQVIAYGSVNNQPVLIHLVLPIEPHSNQDIPEFARQIFRFTN